tara:strand:- start:240 stop:953 length:714 start_codon:yes stop_codon:yes gene_type:complete
LAKKYIMKLNNLKKEAFKANLDIVENNLVTLTWGNASAFDSEKGILAIKPSGVPYSTLKWEDMVLVDLDNNIVDSKLKPSSDTKTHLELYKNFSEIKGVVHTHSKWGTIWSQAQLSIPCLGTTHADHYNSDIPCIPVLTKEQVEGDYERNTGISIVDYYNNNKLNHILVPGCILAGHAPFTWGTSVKDAVDNSIVLEECALMAFYSLQLNKKIKFPDYVLNKHYERKHGDKSYYGQI